MNKSILLYSNADISRRYTPENTTKVALNEINSIPNYSSSIIYFSEIQLFTKDHAKELLSRILDKLKPSGVLILITSNTNKICKDYLLGRIDDDLFVKHNTNNKCVFGITQINGILSSLQDIKLAKLEYDDNESNIIFTLQRVTV